MAPPDYSTDECNVQMDVILHVCICITLEPGRSQTNYHARLSPLNACPCIAARTSRIQLRVGTPMHAHGGAWPAAPCTQPPPEGLLSPPAPPSPAQPSPAKQPAGQRPRLVDAHQYVRMSVRLLARLLPLHDLVPALLHPLEVHILDPLRLLWGRLAHAQLLGPGGDGLGERCVALVSCTAIGGGAGPARARGGRGLRRVWIQLMNWSTACSGSYKHQA